MTQFSTTQIITPAMQDTFDARARKLRSDAFRDLFGSMLRKGRRGSGN